VTWFRRHADPFQDLICGFVGKGQGEDSLWADLIIYKMFNPGRQNGGFATPRPRTNGSGSSDRV
jgi:hypothetical protein